MVIGAFVSRRARVHDHLVEARYLVEQSMVDFVRDGVRLRHRHLGVDEDLDFGVQTMADPAQPQLIDALHALDAFGDRACVTDQLDSCVSMGSGRVSVRWRADACGVGG